VSAGERRRGVKKVGVIGCGRWGRNLARNLAIASNAHLRYFCDIDDSALRDLKDRFGYVNVTADYQEVLRDHDVDAVFIATPTSLHARMAVDALEAGKDVYVEAPMADTVEDAARIRDAAAKSGRILEVGHLHPHNRILEAMRKSMASDDGGGARYAHAQRFSLARPGAIESAAGSSDSPGAGLVYSFAHHDLTAISFLLDAAPRSVEARVYSIGSIGSRGAEPAAGGAAREDVAVIALAFDRGVRAHIHLSVLAPLKERKLTLVGSTRMVVHDEVNVDAKLKIYEIEDPEIFTDRRRTESFGDFQQIQRTGRVIIPNLIVHEPLAVAVDHFIRILHGDAAPALNAAHGARIVEQLETIRRSAAEKKELAFG
jgi:predicted dehydrogenase